MEQIHFSQIKEDSVNSINNIPGGKMNKCVYLYFPVCWAMDLVQHVWTPERCKQNQKQRNATSMCKWMCTAPFRSKSRPLSLSLSLLVMSFGLKYFLVKITSTGRSSSFLVDYFQVWMLVYVCAHDSGGRFPSSIIVCRCSDWKPDWLTNMSWLWPHAALHLLPTILFEYLDYWHHTV